MKRWLVGLLLVVLAGLLLVIVINSNRDPIAVLEEFGAKHEKESAVRTIERNGKGEVIGVNLDSASISPRYRRLLFKIFRFGWPERYLSDAELVHLEGLTKLETLDLTDTELVTDAGLVHLKGLTKLETLDLSGTATTDAGLVHLKGLTNLQTLKLSGGVTDAGLLHLKPLTKLQTLALRHSQITDVGLVYLKGLTKLQNLNLTDARSPMRGCCILRGWPI
jgi:hypothetical protein